MIVRRTAEFAKWLKKLRDSPARYKILDRLDKSTQVEDIRNAKLIAANLTDEG